MTTFTASHPAPNTLAYSARLESGTVVTLFKATPGETAPRMQMQTVDGRLVDCGAIEAPERFGPHSTPAEFRTWVEQFATSA